jgi:DNA-directed RNA polymerase beta subunit
MSFLSFLYFCFSKLFLKKGYDMEDAMIINKSAYERGFGHASVYKTEWVDISPTGKDRK